MELGSWGYGDLGEDKRRRPHSCAAGGYNVDHLIVRVRVNNGRPSPIPAIENSSVLRTGILILIKADANYIFSTSRGHP